MKGAAALLRWRAAAAEAELQDLRVAAAAVTDAATLDDLCSAEGLEALRSAWRACAGPSAVARARLSDAPARAELRSAWRSAILEAVAVLGRARSTGAPPEALDLAEVGLDTAGG